MEANEWEKVLQHECVKGVPQLSSVDLLDSGPNQREAGGTYQYVKDNFKLHGNVKLYFTATHNYK